MALTFTLLNIKIITRVRNQLKKVIIEFWFMLLFFLLEWPFWINEDKTGSYYAQLTQAKW